MSVKKTISVTEFKAKCLEILRHVNEEQVSYTITKHDKIVAEVNPPQPYDQSQGNPLKSSIVYEGDLISPVEDHWEAEK